MPWAALGCQQAQVEIDRLFILAVPSYLQEAPTPEDADAEEARLTDKKRVDVGAAEKQWVARMQSVDAAGSVAAQPGYLQGAVNVVLGNLKVKVPPSPLPLPFRAHTAALSMPVTPASTAPHWNRSVAVKHKLWL